MQVGQTPCACHILPPVCLSDGQDFNAFPCQDHTLSPTSTGLGNRQPQVPLSSRASLIPAMARGQGQHCSPSPASARHRSRPIGAGSRLTCPALHRRQQLSTRAGRAGTVDTAGTCQSSPHTPRGHVGKAINWNVNRSTGKNCLLTTREGCSATVLYHKSHLYDLPSVSQITRVQSPMSAFKSEHGIFSQK